MFSVMLIINYFCLKNISVYSIVFALINFEAVEVIECSLDLQNVKKWKKLLDD